MSKQKPKFYVVWEGLQKGIFDNWNDCKAQVEGQKQAKYKSFETRQEAEIAFAKGYKQFIFPKNTEKQDKIVQNSNFIKNSIVVDGACNGKTGDSEYQGVYLETGERIFHQGVFKNGTNNVMEFLALVHGLAFLQKKESKIPIYSDSRNAITWVKNKKCKTNLEQSPDNKILFELIARAEKWLKENQYENPVLKWETQIWGENPADFGRK